MIRPLALALIVGTLCGGSTCSPPPAQCCGVVTRLSRGVDYVGSVSSAGGTSEVRLNVAMNNNTLLTFTRDGHTIAIGFTGVLGP